MNIPARTAVWFTAFIVLVVLLMWPAGTWLQGSEMSLPNEKRLDAVYLVAGHQDRRIKALVSFVEQLGADDRQHTLAEGGANKKPITTNKSPISNLQVLIGNDTIMSRWSRKEQRNLTMAEWAVAKLEALLQVSDPAKGGINFRLAAPKARHQVSGVETQIHRNPGAPMRISIVPGEFSGTDGEMVALATYLETRPEIRRLAIVTCPFHVRRASWRLQAHLGHRVDIHTIYVEETWRDRAPWVVLGELLKIGRDNLGLTHAPMMSRGTSPSMEEWVALGIIVVMAVVAYGWGFYPVLLASLGGRGKRKEVSPSTTLRAGGKGKTEEASPRVAVVLAAYNEESVMARRLENLVEQTSQFSNQLIDQSSNNRISIFLGSDNSTDRTAEIAREFAEKHSNIHVHEFKERRGKIAVLKDLVGKVEEKHNDGSARINADKKEYILVFTDANTMFREEALEKLLRHFDDPKVGGVCGRLIFKEGEVVSGKRQELDTDSTPALQSLGAVGNQRSLPSEGVYWNLETWMKERESALDSCLGANGAIYAIRRELFWEEIPDNTIVDDFVIGMKVREQGYKMIYEPEAIAEEEFPETVDEWHRRVRIGSGDYQALQLCRACLSPKYGIFSWMFFSHKVLRWFTPHLLLMALTLALYQYWMIGGLDNWCISVIRIIELTNQLIIGGFAVLLLCALLGRLLRASRVAVVRPFKLCDHFVTMQAALFVGFIRFCRGNLKGSWERTPREK